MPLIMESQFVKVNYRNFQDAVDIADKRGDRIRMKDVVAAQSYIIQNGINTERLFEMGLSKPNSAVTIIKKGLMEGVYVSWPDIQESWIYVCSSNTIEPLKAYSEKMEYDVVISYTFDPKANDIIPKLANEFIKLGLRTYVIREGERPDDPLWKVRFREAVFHSYYFMPFLSESYLKGLGTIIELFDIARETVHHRDTDYFYPLLPLVDDIETLGISSLKSRNQLAYDYDPDGYEWIRTHIFPLNLKWGVGKFLVLFFRFQKIIRMSKITIF